MRPSNLDPLRLMKLAPFYPGADSFWMENTKRNEYDHAFWATHDPCQHLTLDSHFRDHTVAASKKDIQFECGSFR
jgi:hypothetical protein